MAKFQDIRALVKQQLQAVTKNGECWKAFLHTAAIAYNYNFPNQLLIYCQNPTATAVADMEYWNKEAGRQVKRGAHGIPVLDVKKEMMALRYLFDISDTIPQARTDKGLPWAVTDQNWKPVWDKIIRDNQADSIQNALLMLSTAYVAQRRGMFLQALAQSVDGSSLQWAKPEEQQQLFLQLITQSCLYMAALRCGVDTQRLDLSAFDSVGQFDTKAMAFCLGSACQRASKPLMHQIGSIAREIDSVARKEKVRYYGGEQAITNHNKEADHGVQNGERIRDPEPDAGRNAEAGDRQVRQYAQEISGGGSTDPVRDDADGGNAVPASGRDQQRREPADRADRATADAADRSARPENGPAGLDAVDERTESPSRGTGDEANLQPVTEPPLEESVQTPSSFSIPTPDLPPLDDSLILGLLAQQTSTRADNADILAYFEKHPDLASRSEFCRTSYKQIYTQLSVGERMAGFIRHDQYLELWEGNYLTKTAQSNLTWDAVSDKIAALIEQGQLPVPIRTSAPEPELEQLTLTPKQIEAVGLSDPQKQQKVIEETAKRKNWKSPTIDASGKYVTEQDITDVLCSGSGFAGGHFRLQEYFSASQLPTEKEQADHLKKEYGIGGCTWKFADGQSGWVSYDGKGLSVQRGFYNDTNSYRRLLRWPEVAKRIRLLVHNDQYLTAEKKTEYNAWLAEQQLHRQAMEAALTHAKTAISDFCEREGLGEPDFSDLTHIDFAYSTTEDSKHDVQIYANLMRNEIRYEVDNRIVHIDHFEDNHALAEQGIAGASFEDFISEAEEAFEEQHAPQKAPEKKPVAAGDTVYLENDHPFTVEEIGIFDVHLRDEDFPLIGRAINRAEFARLLAANPKNNALAAPELPSLPDAGEAAEVVEGEVLEPTDEPAEETPSGFGEQVLQAAELIALKEAYLPNNYIPPQDPAPPRTPREKFAANITAIRTLKSIEKRMADGGPHANGEEQEILAQYSGWGGLSDAFEPNKDSWHGEYTELKSLLTEEEYAAARSSTLTAFYTPPAVIDAMYTALRKMGVGAGTILEPSMGVGAFFGQSHSYLYEPTTRLFGVELDSLTGRIARQLYQKANIQITGFEKADLPDSFFDVVIGNVPFGDYSVVDPQYNRLHFKIHDYFIAKSIDKLRTGGIIAFITTSGTLDKKSEEVRKYINARCDFIGAVRLPDSTFKSAGTKAMADIIFLQKRDRILEQDASWLHTTQTEDGLSLNSYFAEHPEMVCGTLKTVSGPYGPTLNCEAFADKPLPDVLKEAMSHLHAEFHFQNIEEQESGMADASIPAEPDVRNFSFCIRNGKFYYRENAIMREVSLGATSAARMRLLIELRDTTRELIQAQLEDMPDEVITELQGKLNRQYDHYHNKFGLINSRGASLDMRDDSGYFLLCSLENLDSEGNFIGKSDMFSKRTMQGNKIRVLNAAATQEAQMKQQQIEDAFKDWIWKDPTRRQMLVKEYNERFNSLRPREYDGSHILFHGMSPEITLRPHQKNAIAHILYGGNTLLAHVVGAGKTYEMVAAAMEKKRLGLCSKTLICVPNHLTEQLAGEALQLYPNANILVARKTDFEKANRKRFCAKIATGNYDIIVIGHSQFERIPLSQERQVEYLQSQIHDAINQVAQLKEERAENFTVKQMERMRKQLEKKLDKLNDQSRKDDVVTFEQLGVDSLMVDEAHAFKNLAVLSKMRNVAGISQTESQRASDLYMKCRYLDEITGSRGVVFATGTPISNSMAELFTMQRYLQRETLEQHGLSSFDAWASTFGETVTAVELAPEGTGYRTKTRFSKFYNLPELMSMFKQVADVQTADMLNLPVPKLVGGKPINVALPPSPQQKQMVADLADRAEEIRAGNVDPTEDNMLKVTNDGRKLALDQRLIDPNLPENPNDKVHACAENVYRIWNDTKEKRLTQLVFCDLSTPKPDGFNVYDDLRNLLISMGIPENEVQFIHSANTEVKKAELFAKVRSGDVRVLMGSTGKMGAGTNVQRLLVATHHLDCGWKPSDIEQRNGRMIRQGNTNAEVYEYRYVTESSFDSYMWQLLETKQKFIGQVMTSKSPARSADDLDDAALSYAEVKALAAGNPMIKEKMDLDIQVARLKTLKTAYNNEHYWLEDAITQGLPAKMRKIAQQLENAKADTIRLQQNTKLDADGKDVFAISLMDTVYTKREDAGKALLGLLGMAMNRTEPVSIGRYKGFDLQIAYFAMDKMYLAYLVGSGINPVQLGADAVGNTMRLDNCLHNLPQSVTDLESKLMQLQKQLENAKEQLAQPFAQADELAEKSKRLAVLEALLNLNEKDIVLDTVPDEDQQCRSDNRQRGQER